MPSSPSKPVTAPTPKFEASAVPKQAVVREEACGCGHCRAHASGRTGPYTPADFIELFGVVNEPAPVEVPAELAELGIEVDVALARYDRAKSAWEESLVALGAVRQEGAIVVRYGVPVHVQGDPDAVREADEEARAAKALLDEVGDDLSRARAAYNDARRRLTTQRLTEEYAADQAAQAAERAAARNVPDDPSWRGRLARLRAKVS